MSELKNNEILKLSSDTPDNNYWQTFEELYKDPSFVAANQDEFKNGVADGFDTSDMSTISRRKFLALLGASAALAGTACSDYRDKGAIVPYNNKPEEITVGKANYYASTCTSCGNVCGILIKTREGRPIKIDGNPDHPVSKGKICAQCQASIMGLYDPDRLKNPKKKIDGRLVDYNWKDADSDIILDLMNAGNKEIAIIAGRIVSPTALKVLEDFKNKFPSANIYSYEQFNESVRNSAWKKCSGTDSFPFIKWDEAKVILSLDGDFLGESFNQVENARLFAEGRDVMTKKFNRLYVVEGNPTVTGMNADYRLRLRPDAQFNFIMCLIDELKSRGTISIPVNTSGYSMKEFAGKHNLNLKNLSTLVNDLTNNQGSSIVFGGNHLTEKVHIAVNVLNDALGNSRVYNNTSLPFNVFSLSQLDSLKSLINKINDNRVAAVIHLNTNPVYNFPADLKYADAIQKVETVVSFVEVENETSQLSNFVLPSNHTLESWGDARSRTDFYSLQQPVISPLYDTRQQEAVLLTWIYGFSEAYNEKLYHQFLMDNWMENIYPSLNSKVEFKQFWFKALHDGIVLKKESTTQSLNLDVAAASLLTNEQEGKGFSLHLKESFSLKDGRFANNGWLQELPHPVSKITWDNYVSVSPVSAKELGVKNNDVVEIKVEGNSLEIPVFIQPGAADGFLTIESGFGRTSAGTVGTGVGFNANKIFTVSETPYLKSGVEISKTGSIHKLTTAQVVYAFDEGRTKDLPEKRGIIREGTVDQYLEDSHFLHAKSEHKDYTVYTPFEYTGLKWGMAIDLNKCIGCGDCIIACNVENNIPVVGKDQVANGREMHWIRVDRYYSGTAEDPSISNQVMLCQHCDQAPCENVCPVVATTHSPDGLNQMVYNRCVGTRYCSNNCPYKVRRFNYFNFRDHFRSGFQESPVFNLLHNPEVTVRSRGVMEKCTFCIQRISEARSDAVRENRTIKGSDVKTACQEACGTNAIQFGDINDKDSEFFKFRNHELGYYVLEELNIKPNVTYIAKLRNIEEETA
jgi:molybdopterin-containing oxidoreductase family iron-sulfur binding subunit